MLFLFLNRSEVFGFDFENEFDFDGNAERAGKRIAEAEE